MFKDDLNFLERYFQTSFKEEYKKLDAFSSFVFDNEELFFEIQGSIIFVDFVLYKICETQVKRMLPIKAQQTIKMIDFG